MLKSFLLQSLVDRSGDCISEEQEFAREVAKGNLPEEEDFDAGTKITDAAQEILNADEVEGFLDYDSDGEREFYRLDNGAICVHWTAAQYVEIGSAKELAEKYVESFRKWAQDKAENAEMGI